MLSQGSDRSQIRPLNYQAEVARRKPLVKVGSESPTLAKNQRPSAVRALVLRVPYPSARKALLQQAMLAAVGRKMAFQQMLSNLLLRMLTVYSMSCR